jgi:hypothetical protein
MEMETKTGASKQIILDDNSRFSYIIKQVEITNVLGTAVAILDEYFITNSAGENYKLYKTKEGNWYDLDEVMLPEKIIINRALKTAIQQLERG